MPLIISLTGIRRVHMVRCAACQNETAVTVAAVCIADGRINLQPDAWVTKGRASNIAGTHASDAGRVSAGCFRRLGHDAPELAALTPRCNGRLLDGY